MNALPKITIITPSYNQGQFIEETILSVINQNYPNLEYIIIDGGSTDNTIDILKKYDKLITYWVSEKDKGTYDANNKALERITGDYWCVVNSDDILLPNALHKVAECIQKTNSHWITGGEHVINEHGDIKAKQFPERPKEVSGLSFLDRNWIFHPATFLHKDVIKKIGLFSPDDIMDYDYWIRMEMAGYRPYILKEYLCGLRFHTTCKSADYLQQYKEIVRLLKNVKHELKNKNWPHSLHDLQHRINQWTSLSLQSEILFQLYHKKYGKAVRNILLLWTKNPLVIFKRWYLGLFIRFFKPVNEKEFNPLHDIL